MPAFSYRNDHLPADVQAAVVLYFQQIGEKEPHSSVKALLEMEASWDKTNVLDIYNLPANRLSDGESAPEKAVFVAMMRHLFSWPEDLNDYMPTILTWLQQNSCLTKRVYEITLRALTERGNPGAITDSISLLNEANLLGISNYVLLIDYFNDIKLEILSLLAKNCALNQVHFSRLALNIDAPVILDILDILDNLNECTPRNMNIILFTPGHIAMPIRRVLTFLHSNLSLTKNHCHLILAHQEQEEIYSIYAALHSLSQSDLLTSKNVTTLLEHKLPEPVAKLVKRMQTHSLLTQRSLLIILTHNDPGFLNLATTNFHELNSLTQTIFNALIRYKESKRLKGVFILAIEAFESGTHNKALLQHQHPLEFAAITTLNEMAKFTARQCDALMYSLTYLIDWDAIVCISDFIRMTKYVSLTFAKAQSLCERYTTLSFTDMSPQEHVLYAMFFINHLSDCNTHEPDPSTALHILQAVAEELDQDDKLMPHVMALIWEVSTVYNIPQKSAMLSDFLGPAAQSRWQNQCTIMSPPNQSLQDLTPADPYHPFALVTNNHWSSRSLWRNEAMKDDTTTQEHPTQTRRLRR